MENLRANDLRDLIKEVVSAYWAEKRNSWIIESPQVIEEGVYDPGILKAVFTAGGPGKECGKQLPQQDSVISLLPPNSGCGPTI